MKLGKDLEMRQRILDILKEVNEDIIIYEGNDMLGDSVIDSFEIIEIISKLEEEFKIEIDAVNIVAANFKNKETIITMLEKLIAD